MLAKNGFSTTKEVVLLPFQACFAARFCRPSQANGPCDFFTQRLPAIDAAKRLPAGIA
ncbi:hypothetical protein [Mesorhizobium sp. Root695]|uniref:hypothetical protein n=1 Tax=Mesorhizobium sp. Root695 TaxID=1736589 RepID=UPI000A82437C|nr:hypothetical protein [Mesorhizobium sp. Root695]